MVRIYAMCCGRLEFDRIFFFPEEAPGSALTIVRLVPGMPVDAFIQTGQCAVLSYLIKPLQDPVAKAFREK